MPGAGLTLRPSEILREAQAILFRIASTFTNLEVDRIQCGYFLTMYGDGPVAAALNERLQPLAG